MSKPLLETLLAVAARYSHCSVKQFKSKVRNRHLDESRLLFVALAKSFNYRHYEIGWALDRTRTTINHYAKKTKECAADPYFERQVAELIKRATK